MLRLGLVFVAFAAASISIPGVQAGRNNVEIHGRAQDIYYYPALGKSQGMVLFLPGDGGWRGFAVDMAHSLSSDGFDVYGWDVKQYLSEFTSSHGTLTQADIQSDMANLARRLAGDGTHRVILVGWSQGAAMAVLAASAPENQKTFSGVVALGLPESAVLGWRFVDNLTNLTRIEAKEPRFETAPLMPRVAPLRLGMIHSSADEYVTVEAARRLFSLAREPKRLDFIVARDHRYDGNHDEFFRVLKDQVVWAGELQ